ncbi:MAG: hypothetical protein BWK72_07500 [Rhodoferax ferrireducens]|uniref:Uncharacterized protein n=2 Tax=Pseudomonadota TaxID=1224 RepID=A0A1Y1QZN1_9GAMM|nr:MAG: hypothetical protein BWK72_07500 [Rhodoferax ferrireducens]OQX17342.1 MAG: hypothetical protein BWK73_01270 [Thiothrix lacustris]
MKISGFEWGDGNWPKCGKPVFLRKEIEQVLVGRPAMMPYRKTMIRPISARYKYQKEIDHYESTTQTDANSCY